MAKELDYRTDIEQLVFMLSMNTNLLDWKKINAKIEMPSSDFYYITISSSERTDFDMTAFIKYSFMYEEYLDKLEVLLKNCINKPDFYNDEINNLEEKINDLKEKFIQAIESYFRELKRAYRKWYNKYGNMIIPIHNFDLTYNMIKRLYQDGKKKNVFASDIHERGKFFYIYMEMILFLMVYLRKIDEYYCIEETGKSFAARLENNPFVIQICKFVKDLDDEDYEFYNFIEENINAMVGNLLDEETVGISGDDNNIN